jgi:hypothetical protein
MYVTPYTYHGATSVRLGTHGLRLDPRAAQHPQPAGWAAAHCEHPRARAQQQNPGPKPEAWAAAGPRGWRWARSGPGFCKQISRGFPRVPGFRVAGAGFGFAFTVHGPCQVSRGYRIGLSADYIYLDLPAPYMCRLLATILMARGRWGFQFSSDSDD